MTVYKPISQLAPRIAEAAVALARRQKVETKNSVNNGKIDVLSIPLEPIMVDKNNLRETVIKDGCQKTEDVYKNVPPEQRPK